MIMSIARDYIQPDKVSQYMTLIQRLIEETKKEEGNLDYILFSDRDQEGYFVLLEYWEDQKSLDAHFQTGHFTTIVPEIQKLHLKPTQVNTYEKVRWEPAEDESQSAGL